MYVTSWRCEQHINTAVTCTGVGSESRGIFTSNIFFLFIINLSEKARKCNFMF